MLWAKLIVFNNLSFRLIKSPEAREIFEFGPSTMNMKMGEERLKHLIVEMYAYVQNVIAQKIAHARLTNQLPLFHISADAWKSKPQNQKYLGLRVWFVDEKWKLQSFSIAVWEFSPTYVARSSIKLSKLHALHTQCILQDFGFGQFDIYGATTDSGSDVKACVSAEMHLQWEWCIPHMVNRCVLEAFGDTEKKKNSKNKEARSFVK